MKKIIITVSGIIILFILILVTVFRSSSGFRSINLVPEDAVLIIESKDPVKAWDEIIHSNAWGHLSSNPLLEDINTEIQSFDSLVNSSKILMKLVGEKPVTISQHLKSNNEYDFLYIVEVGMAGMFKKPEKLISAFLDYDDYELTSREYHKESIIEIFDKKQKDYYFLSFIRGKLVFSYDPSLVESAIIASEKSRLGKNTKLLDVYPKVSGKGLVNIYINHKNTGKLIDSLSPEFKTGIYSKMFQFTAFSFEITKEGLIDIEGYASLSDSVKSAYAELFQKGNIELKTAKVIPNRLASLVKINFKDASDYFHSSMQLISKEEYNSYIGGLIKIEKRFKLNIEDNLFSWMDEEIVLLQTKPSNLGRKNEFAAVIHASDSTKTADNLAFIWRQLKKNSPVKIKSVLYKGYKIDYIAFPGFLKMLFGKLLDKIEKPYFSQIGKNVIISNHPQTIKNLIDDYQNGLTLETSDEYENFCDLFDNKQAVFAYFEPPILFYNMQDILSPESWKELKQNKEYFTCFSQAGVALNTSDGLIHFDIKAQYKPEKNQWNREYYSTNDILSMFKTSPISLKKGDESSNDTSAYSIPQIIIQQLDSKKQTEYFEDGSIKRKIELKNGLLDGSFKEYYPNGILKIKGDFKDGKPKGKWKFYDKDGKLDKVEKY